MDGRCFIILAVMAVAILSACAQKDPEKERFSIYAEKPANNITHQKSLDKIGKDLQDFPVIEKAKRVSSDLDINEYVVDDGGKPVKIGDLYRYEFVYEINYSYEHVINFYARNFSGWELVFAKEIKYGETPLSKLIKIAIPSLALVKFDNCTEIELQKQGCKSIFCPTIKMMVCDTRPTTLSMICRKTLYNENASYIAEKYDLEYNEAIHASACILQ